MVQAQEPGQGVQRLQEALQEAPQEASQEHHHHHHHHHPRKEPEAMAPTDHHLTEGSKEEQLEARDLSLTDFQRGIILTQWTMFMRQL